LIRTDVVVVGGGPGGSVCAAQLARRGLRVLVFEKERFPRFHLGESLLPHSMPVLEEIGVIDAVRERFLPKYGARFHDDRTGRKDRFVFGGAWRTEIDHAFEVPRDEFDALLLNHARACGAEVREGVPVERILYDDKARTIGVEAGERIEAGFVVDASGRDALTAHARRETTRIEGLDQTALYAHFSDVPRREGLEEGDIDIVLFGETRPEWFWFIPFRDGRTSVGAVMSRSWMRVRAGRSPAELFDEAVRQSPTASSLLAGAKCLWPKIEATADFSYRVRSMTGAGWVAVGDSAGFIDPLFSTGAHLAMVSGKLAADAIADGTSFAEWESRVRTASETFVTAVQAFYAGPLVDLLFAPDKRAPLRRSVTSLLAGDVFGDAVWLRDARMRLNEMLVG
jgi:flavin-dependent dehydrogenase